jgi:hypothetical protein
MSNMVDIIQRGVIKSVPQKHAKILVALKKATYPDPVEQSAEVVSTEGGEFIDTVKPKRTYQRKDLTAGA